MVNAKNIRNWLKQSFDQKRIFIKSNDKTIHFYLKPYQQITFVLAIVISGLWIIFSTSFLVLDNNFSDHNSTESLLVNDSFQQRLNLLADEKNLKEIEASQLQRQFYAAIAEISKGKLISLKTRKKNEELEQALKSLQEIINKPKNGIITTKVSELNVDSQTSIQTIRFLSQALEEKSEIEADIIQENIKLKKEILELKHKALVSTERSERIFSRLEEALSVSVAPLERMFEDVGISTEKLLKDVRRGYSGKGGPILPLLITKGKSSDNRVNNRANKILKDLDTLNLYRIAAFQLPFSHPLKVRHRFTSGYGNRKDPFTGKKQMHAGIDLAAYSGSKIHTTADGTVTKAWPSGAYGKLIEIRHAMGYSTRYAHLKKIRVKAGQRVSRGDIIGDMGNTGRSTGTHLHYEIRKNGKTINPMKYIKAARNVF